MDCIRTISEYDTAMKFDEKIRWGQCRYYFTKLPQQVQKNDLMFFSFWGYVRAVGRIVKIEEAYYDDLDYPYWIHVADQEHFTCDYEYKGFVGIRYVPNLRAQYGGIYRELSEYLEEVAADYRERHGILRKR
jgi:hypothetical protein